MGENFCYLRYVIMEGLRMSPPLGETTWLSMIRDTKIGNMLFKKGDIFEVNFTALHYDKV